MLNSAERYVSGFINSFIKACLPVSQVASKNLVLDYMCIRKSFFVSFFVLLSQLEYGFTQVSSPFQKGASSCIKKIFSLGGLSDRYFL